MPRSAEDVARALMPGYSDDGDFHAPADLKAMTAAIADHAEECVDAATREQAALLRECRDALRALLHVHGCKPGQCVGCADVRALLAKLPQPTPEPPR